ncbi:hypothetical protein FQA39_LY02663 [Lamprigera yunnana]|nr:hypothetical protein FQA39_LY02663 [Lamprigera yunnana]
MHRSGVLLLIFFALISSVLSYVPRKGGKHSLEHGTFHKDEVNHHDELNHKKEDKITYPVVIENQDLTPKDDSIVKANDDKQEVLVKEDEASKQVAQENNAGEFTSVLKDDQKVVEQEQNKKSSVFNDGRQEQIEIQQLTNDSTVSHKEDHHMKNLNEEKHVFKKVTQSNHHDEVNVHSQVNYNQGSSGQTGENTSENEHKISIKEDEQKVSLSNLDDKKVEHKHNEQSFHFYHKDNPSHHGVEHHVKVDNGKEEGIHHELPIVKKVPLLTGAEQSSSLDENVNTKVSVSESSIIDESKTNVAASEEKLDVFNADKDEIGNKKVDDSGKDHLQHKDEKHIIDKVNQDKHIEDEHKLTNSFGSEDEHKVDGLPEKDIDHHQHHGYHHGHQEKDIVGHHYFGHHGSFPHDHHDDHFGHPKFDNHDHKYDQHDFHSSSEEYDHVPDDKFNGPPHFHHHHAPPHPHHPSPHFHHMPPHHHDHFDFHHYKH